MFEKGGTCCPTCGTRQAHIHLGWLRLDKKHRIGGSVLFTQVRCKECGWISIIVRFNEEQTSEVYKELDEAIRKVFEKRR